MIQFIELSVTVFYAYIGLGLLFGLWFIFKGVYKVDTGTNGTSLGLRFLLLPGAIALWPILLRKYYRL
ncbi:MAG: hypothetical protein ACI8P3_003934 [Saprospiraceae bacterium]|jgi:hypothetical protein